ncbi:GFA family protein [uncultured Methylibium sp.]|uniref:GFA family protein n=1 Tax=uncultured Methylibium sp. TaxID=381093 RepID=UPI0025D5200D|nr:GFA family protein [uncultured Methylibium sp.]
MTTRTASCCCGQLRIEVEGDPQGVGVCHCLACQQRTGSVFAALAAFAAPYRVVGQATEFVRAGDQGAKFRFRFCPVCGSNLFHTEEGREALGVAVAVGGFADPAFPPPQDSVYDCRRHPWVQLPAGVTVFDKDPE